MKKLLLLMLLIIPLIAMAEPSYMFKQNDLIDLKVSCYNETFDLCPISTTCNITIIAPNSSVIINNQQLINYTTYYSITDAALSRDLGEYSCNVYCWGTTNGFSTFTYLVTTTGTEFTTAQGILYIVFLIATIIIFILSLYGAIQLPYKNTRDDEGAVISVNDLKYLKIFLWVTSYLVLMSLFGLLRGVTANYIPEIGVYRMFNWMFWIMLSFTWPLIVCSLLFALILFLQDKKITKALEGGLPIR